MALRRAPIDFFERFFNLDRSFSTTGNMDFLRSDGSGVNREIPAPFCEGLGVKFPGSTLPEFLEFTPSEFRGGGPIEKLIALIPIPKFHLTRYYGVFASRSALRNKLPDIPEPASELNISTDDNESPSKNLKQKGRRRRCKKPIGWAALLKRTFGMDVLSCQKCGSRMTLVGVVFDAKTIAVTLNAIGVSPRAPPIAPARARQQTVFDHVDTCYEYEYVD